LSKQLNQLLYSDFVLLNKGCINRIFDRCSVAGAIVTGHNPCELLSQLIADSDCRIPFRRHNLLLVLFTVIFT